MGKINEPFIEYNIHQQESRKAFTECVLFEVTYGRKGYRIWVKNHRSNKGNNTWLINIYFRGKTDLI